jgi:LacI family transcriptional regulator
VSRATQADVARVAGTSMAVVSYVINGGPRPVAAGTRQRVLEAIVATGYRPNSAARALAGGSTLTCGLIVPDVANEFFAELARAVERAARRSGRTVLLANSDGDTGTEHALLDTFLRRQIDGVVLVSTAPDEAHRELVEASTRAVFLGAAPAGAVAPSIAVDNEGGAFAATRHLVDHGYPTVAMIAGPSGDEVASARLAGWRRAVDGVAGRHVVQPYTVDGGYLGALDLFDAGPRPRAVFVAADRQAIGLLRAAADRGLAVPDDLAVATFDGSAASAYAIPSLTTVQQPVAEMAELAVKLLLDADQRPGATVLDVGLVVRRSCGCTDPGPLSLSGME